jgi:hypothetical protein
MWASISRSEGQELEAENVIAKTTASPVRMVAKNATLNCADPMIRSLESGAAQATAAVPATAAVHHSQRRWARVRANTPSMVGTRRPPEDQQTGIIPMILLCVTGVRQRRGRMTEGVSG